MRTPPVRLFLSVSVTAALGLSCATVLPYPLPADAGLTGTRSQFHQSCGPACATPIAPSTGEILVPAATRAGQVLGKAVQAAEVIQGLLNVSKFLDEAQKERAEKSIVECVKEAHFKVDEDLFGKGKSLPAEDCKKPPTVEKKLAPTWRRHLGILKHTAAFACIQQRFSEEFPDNFSVEPRYRKDELTNELMLTDRLDSSLRPDLVLHFTRNATRIQCIYEFKFPCGEEKNDPWSIAEVQKQMKDYAALGGECKPVLVTPLMGLDRR